jgi:hypothetical protein
MSISDFVSTYNTKDILNELDYEDIVEYVNSINGLYRFEYDTNNEVINALEGIGSYIRPRARKLSNEELKKEICDFIDFWRN